MAEIFLQWRKMDRQRNGRSAKTPRFPSGGELARNLLMTNGMDNMATKRHAVRRAGSRRAVPWRSGTPSGAGR
jgi:hypothetical protein